LSSAIFRVPAIRCDLPAGMTLLRFGLPGDHSIEDNAVGLLT
jgi:hypothetical protein